MKKVILVFFCLLALAACRSKQPVVVPPAASEAKPPLWVSNRPNNGLKFVGIGVGDKLKGSDYRMEAKKNALYDLASEIKVDISTNSVLYTVQNNNNFSENFNSLIKLSNSDNIEGYTLVDSYENDKQYWVYYQLDKQEYLDQKAKKKQQVLTRAANLIAASFNDEKNRDFSSCLKKRIQAFGVLSPYLSEEINFDPAVTNGIRSVFDLTNLIQQQLQSITVVPQKTVPALKPYQASYAPLVYRLELTNKTPLQNFPLLVHCEQDQVSVNEKSGTNSAGEVQVKVSTVEPLNQFVSFSLNPDISTLMGSDSVGRAGITLLQQFVQTPSLRVQANVTTVGIYISAVERNFGKPTGSSAIEGFIKQRFNGQEVRLTDQAADADYIIEALADTQEDISSDVLEKNYRLKLAALQISLQLKNRATNEVLYKTQISDIYGYANSAEKAGLNAYSNPKVNTRLSESVFFLKRKILVY